MRFKNTIIFLIFILFLFIQNTVMGHTFSVWPNELNFTNVKREGYTSIQMTVYLPQYFPDNVTNFDGVAIARISVWPEEIREWVTFKPSQNFSLLSSTPYFIQVIVSPPLNVPDGEYSGDIKIELEDFIENSTMQDKIYAVNMIKLNIIVRGDFQKISMKEIQPSNSIKLEHSRKTKWNMVIFYTAIIFIVGLTSFLIIINFIVKKSEKEESINESCLQCGNKITEDDIFCPECGTRVKVTENEEIVKKRSR